MSNQGQADIKKIQDSSKQAIQSKKNAIQKLRQIKQKLEDYLRGCNVASTAGNMAQIAGTLMLFTPLVLFGAAAIAAGTITNISSDAFSSSKENGTMKEVAQLIDNDTDQTARFIECLSSIGEKIEKKIQSKVQKKVINKALEAVLGKDTQILKIYKAAKSSKKFSKAFQMAADLQKTAKVGKAAVSVTSVARQLKGGLFVAVGVGISVYEIIQTWTADNQTVGKLNFIIKNLEEQLKDLNELHNYSLK
ncbi:UNKNOWN [Stylonychia lemnae]|uniref:Uncharacterized protein n=1 Tax=Stylonychia lemnae TaxID=5949 RepID=A0A078AWV7_STYLE|nr:UNKNOWN [Stylonychia lemnae]|eukprot:CDW86915.1 UNKNOWN [Stylonychia lemnae]